MHDQLYAEQIIREAESNSQERRIKTISLEVGDLAPLTAEQLEHAIRNQRPGWRVKIYPKDGKIRCDKCDYEGKPKITERLHETVVYECPICREDLPEILDGERIILKSIEVED